MRLLKNLFGRSRKSSDLTTDGLWAMMVGGTTKSGAAVNAETAIRVAAVMACVRVIAEDTAKLPFKLYKESDNQNKRIVVKNHPVHRVLKRPNSWMTGQEFREYMTAAAALWGNAYAIKTKSPITGKLLELIPVPPGMVEVEQTENYDLVYKITMVNGVQRQFASHEIFHLRGACLNSTICGTKIFRMAREAIGLSMTAEEYQATMAAKGATPPGMLTTDQNLTIDQVKEFLKLWKENYAGANNAGTTPVLHGGIKYLQMGLSGRDAQQIENRKFQVEEICRFFRVLPNKAFGAEGSQTYASAAQFAVDHVIDTIQPWATRWEGAADLRLLTEDDEAEGYYTHIPLQALMRGDATTRGAYFKTMRECAVMSVNEIRALDDMDELEDPAFNDPRLPLNTNPLPAGTPAPDGGSNK